MKPIGAEMQRQKQRGKKEGQRKGKKTNIRRQVDRTRLVIIIVIVNLDVY
jgi:hypothetical protein